MIEQLKKQLLAEISRRNIDFVVAKAEETPQLIAELVKLSNNDDQKLSMRASWALEKLSEKHPEILTDFLPDIVKSLCKLKFSGARRCISKVLMLHTIKEEQEGELLDFCFSMLESPKEPVAVKANCMTCVFKLLPKYPEIKNELFALIEDQIPHNSVGFASRFSVLKRRYKVN